MAATFLMVEDLAPFAEIPKAKAQAMIDDAMALAARVAPCINDDTFKHTAAARAIMRGAILRWHEAGTGAMQTETGAVDDYSFNRTLDNRQQRRGMFWPSEINQLQDLCKDANAGGAFGIDTAGAYEVEQHADICSLRFGALYCSCGAVLTMGLPLYENL